MRRVFVLMAVIGLLAGSPSARAGDILDRMVATVNGHIILQSDWADALRFQAFVDSRALDQFSAAERKTALDHLIDQELLQEQMGSSDFQHASEGEIQQRIQEIRARYPGTGQEQGWRDTLEHFGFTESELKRHLGLELDLMRLVDARLRPNVTIDAKSIESYYSQELLPQLRQSGKGEVPLVEASPKIKELLTQQKMNELLVAWLQNLRSGSEIQTEPAAAGSRSELQ
ncbi:MAG: SurA N-terminal domain-containing protein [Terriglobales bacterium]